MANDIKLTMGTLSYQDTESGDTRKLEFQFNPAELSRSRSVSITYAQTGDDAEPNKPFQRGQKGRKSTRKAEPWSMELNLRFDASVAPHGSTGGSYKDQVQRVRDGIAFLESIVQPGPFESENDPEFSFQEDPPTPWLELAWGYRTWTCVAKNVNIKELQYTPDLYPTRVEATVSLELVETEQQRQQGKTGGRE